jgi:hypothetical protein
MQTVTVLHAEFSTELVVILYSGWIVQLVNASFAWRTHCFFLALALVLALDYSAFFLSFYRLSKPRKKTSTSIRVPTLRA